MEQLSRVRGTDAGPAPLVAVQSGSPKAAASTSILGVVVVRLEIGPSAGRALTKRDVVVGAIRIIEKNLAD